MSPARGTGRAGDARRAASGPGARRTGRGSDGGSGRGSVGDAVRERADGRGSDTDAAHDDARDGTTPATGSGGAGGSGGSDTHDGRDGTGDRNGDDRGTGERGTGERGTGERGTDERGSGTAARTAADAARAERAAAAAAERRRYRRRRLAAGLLLTAVLLAALAWGAWWALGRFGPGVQEIRVDGVRTIAANDVRTAAGVPDGTPLAAVDTAAVAARISGIPGVADVDVSRAWPHTLAVAVVERAPVALVDAPDGPRLVDATGLAYRTVPAASCPPAPAACRPPGLPRLALPRVAPDDPATLAALAVVEALPADVRGQVDAVELGSGGTTLELALTDGRRVLWGRWADADGPARRAAVLGPLLTREGSVYDVSSADLPTVRR